MATPLLLLLARQIRRPEAAVSDGELLTRFADSRDQDSFAELVRRHGPVVYRICRRLIGPSNADDAFQATFLVLANRLEAARSAHSVGGWLVGVAGRVARQMQRSALRRGRHEFAASEANPSYPPDAGPDLREQFRILDEELTRLPDRLRGPIVSCLLQGRTQDQVAAELGFDPRTLRRRLDEAKRLLKTRLVRRGVVPAVAVGLSAGVEKVSAVMPPKLTERMVELVFDYLSGGAALSCTPALLAKGIAMKSMTRKIVQLVVASAIGLGGLGFVLADGKDGKKIAPPMAAPAVAVQPGAAAEKAVATNAPFLPITEQLSQPSWQKEEALAKNGLADIAANGSAGDWFVHVQGMCLRMRAGFCEDVGLSANTTATTDNPATTTLWTLTQRETRMLTSLIRTERTKEMISRPTIVTMSLQAARICADEQVEAITELEPSTQNGKTVYIPTTKKLDLGVSLMVTPKISADGKRVTLSVESNSAELIGGIIEIPIKPKKDTQVSTKTKQTVPVRIVGPGAVNKSAFRVSADIANGETVVIRSAPDAKKKQEMIWMLTVHLGVGQKK